MTTLNWLAASLLTLTTLALLLSRDWRWNLAMLAVQYLGAFWLTHSHWPFSMSAVKIIAGWMACAILGITFLSSASKQPPDSSWLEGRLFRFLAGILAAVASFTLATKTAGWLSVDLPVAWGGLLLIIMGLLLLGMSDQPFRVILGLLTILSGFETLYAAVENSTLVAALLAATNLGIALAGAYILNLTALQDEI